MKEKIVYFLKLIGAWILTTLFVGGMLGSAMQPQAAFVWGAFIATGLFIFADYWRKNVS